MQHYKNNNNAKKDLKNKNHFLLSLDLENARKRIFIMSTTRWWWARRKKRKRRKRNGFICEYSEKEFNNLHGKFWNFWPNFIHLKTFFFAQSSAFIIVFNLYFSPDYKRVCVWPSLCSFFYIYSLSFILSFSRWRLTSGERERSVLFYDFAGQLLSLYWFTVYIYVKKKTSSHIS